MEPMAPDPSFTPTQLAARAAYLLRGNDLGAMTTAAPLSAAGLWGVYRMAKAGKPLVPR